MRNYLVKSNASLFDSMFDDFFKPMFYDDSARSYMATDVKKSENGYELEIEIPGFEKKDIAIDFEKGYLTISAKKELNDSDGKYLSRERVTAVRRSFYVGDVDETAITAKYTNGVLAVNLPKKEQPQITARKIEIE